jgi:hypothetical protein
MQREELALDLLTKEKRKGLKVKRKRKTIQRETYRKMIDD